MPHLRRSDKEAEARHANREKLAKRVAKAVVHDPFSARMVEAKPVKRKAQLGSPSYNTDGIPGGSVREKMLDAGYFKGDAGTWITPNGDVFSFEQAREDFLNSQNADDDEPDDERFASHQVDELKRKAVHFAFSALREAGLHNVSLKAEKVRVAEAVTGPRFNLIKRASVQLSATIPYSVGHRIASKPFRVHLTFGDGRFSLDSLEKNRQVLAVNKSSIRQILAMPDSMGHDDGAITNAGVTKPSDNTSGRADLDANDDVKRHRKATDDEDDGPGVKADDDKREASCSGKGGCSGKCKKKV